MTDSCLLIGDIGGTNARFALADADKPGYSSELILPAADYPSADLAIAAYLEQVGSPVPKVICLGAAGPVIDERVQFTNSDWSIDARQLRLMFPAVQVRLMNDFEAIAHSLPVLQESDLETIGPVITGGVSDDDYTLGVLGAGTGLGVAGLMNRNGRTYPIVGEGSHSGFSPENHVQREVLEELRKKFGRVSEERLLSGAGLENIYRALQNIHGEKGAGLAAVDIFKRALFDEDRLSVHAVDLFFEVLGQVAGNLALILGAWDGIYIGGGIVIRYPDLLKASKFRYGFENKGRYRAIMENIPSFLITHEFPGLLGASHVAAQMLAEQ